MRPGPKTLVRAEEMARFLKTYQEGAPSQVETGTNVERVRRRAKVLEKNRGRAIWPGATASETTEPLLL